MFFLTQKLIKSILSISNLTLTCRFENSTMNDNYELSLEKFDIAKQTGIEYPNLKILFHRYGSAIEEMDGQCCGCGSQRRQLARLV